MNVQKVHNGAKQGFQDVKLDISALEIRTKLLESENSRLREDLLKLRIDQSQASLKEISVRLESVEKTLKGLKEENTQALRVVSAETNTRFTHEMTGSQETEIHFPVQIPQKEKDPLKDELLHNYQKNRKDIIKQQILYEIRLRPIAKNELCDTIVRKRNYCSKASFYRYLEEIEKERLIVVERKEDKEVLISLNL